MMGTAPPSWNHAIFIIPAALGCGCVDFKTVYRGPCKLRLKRALKRSRLRDLDEKLQHDLYGPQCGAGLIELLVLILE